jgi:hypothetical protein
VYGKAHGWDTTLKWRPNSTMTLSSYFKNLWRSLLVVKYEANIMMCLNIRTSWGGRNRRHLTCLRGLLQMSTRGLLHFVRILLYMSKHCWLSMRKNVRSKQCFKPIFNLNPSGYHIEWWPLWNMAIRFHIMSELDLWNLDQICILILLKP